MAINTPSILSHHWSDRHLAFDLFVLDMASVMRGHAQIGRQKLSRRGCGQIELSWPRGSVAIFAISYVMSMAGMRVPFIPHRLSDHMEARGRQSCTPCKVMKVKFKMSQLRGNNLGCKVVYVQFCGFHLIRFMNDSRGNHNPTSTFLLQ